jgi:MraZ protein
LRNSVWLKCDKQGRIIIPQQLLGFAAIKKEVVIIGALNYLELWDPEVLNNHSESQIPLDDDYFDDLTDVF